MITSVTNTFMTKKNERDVRAKRNTIKLPYSQDCWTNASLPFTNYCLLTNNMKMPQTWCNFLENDKAFTTETTRELLSESSMRVGIPEAALDRN